MRVVSCLRISFPNSRKAVASMSVVMSSEALRLAGVPKVEIRLSKTRELGANGLIRIFDMHGRLVASYKGSDAPKASLLPAGSAPGLYIAVRPDQTKTTFTNFATSK